MSEPVRMAGVSQVQVQTSGVAVAKGGETPKDVAGAHRVSVESLLAVNQNIKSGEQQLKAGTELRLPLVQAAKVGTSGVGDLPTPLPRPVDGFEKVAVGTIGPFGPTGAKPGPIDPVPDGRRLDAVPLHDLQRSLRTELTGDIPGPLPHPAHDSGLVSATPIPIPHPLPDPGPFRPAGLVAEQDVPPAPPPPPPEPEPEPIPEGKVFQTVGMKAVQDVEGGPEPDPGPDPIPEGKAMLGQLLGASAARLKTAHDPDPGPDPLMAAKH